MGISGDLYRILAILHVLCAIVGFGAVFLNGVYAAQMRRRGGREALAIAEANHVVTQGWAVKFIVAVPISGIVLVLGSHGTWSFGQAWIWAALVLFAASFALAEFLVEPTARRMRSLMGELSAGTSGGCGNCSGGCAGAGSGETDAERVVDTDAERGVEDCGRGSGSPEAATATGVRRPGATLTEERTAGATATQEAPDPVVLREKALELGMLGKRMGAYGGVLHLSLVAMLYLMVFKP